MKKEGNKSSDGIIIRIINHSEFNEKVILYKADLIISVGADSSTTKYILRIYVG